MWCFDSGTTIAPGLAMAIAGDAQGLLTDRWNRLSNRYSRISLQVLRQRGAELAAPSGAPPDHIDAILRAAQSKDAVAALGWGVFCRSRISRAFS